MSNNQPRNKFCISLHKLNSILAFVVLFIIGFMAANQLYYNKPDVVDALVLIPTLLFVLIALPFVFFKVTKNYPNISIHNGTIYYNNFFQKHEFNASNSKIYLERKFMLDFLVITDYKKTTYINIHDIDEDFYNKLLAVTNKPRRI